MSNLAYHYHKSSIFVHNMTYINLVSPSFIFIQTRGHAVAAEEEKSNDLSLASARALIEVGRTDGPATAAFTNVASSLHQLSDVMHP